MGKKKKKKKASKSNPYKSIPDSDHVARRCSAQRLETDAKGNITGVSPAFFKLRPEYKEKDLSCNWLEHVADTRKNQLAAVKKSMLKMAGGMGSRVILSHVKTFKNIGNRYKINLVFKTKGRKQDPSYSGIYGMPLDNSNMDLLAALAKGAVSDILDLGPWPQNPKNTKASS